MSEICVVHLVRECNGLKPFKLFLDSYLKYPAGVEHELLILYKGFKNEKNITLYELLLNKVPHNILFVNDFGFDIQPYFTAVKKYKYKYFIFINSFSQILDADWLLKFYKHASQIDVGLVGATGSYQSIYTDFFKHDWVSNKWLSPKSWAYNLYLQYHKIKMSWYINSFSPFPNYHIRTNAFMITRELMCKIKYRTVITKLHAWMFESSKLSLTNQVMAFKLKVLVVGRDGIGYDCREWIDSNTFWQRDQGNLLIMDNQTLKYNSGDQDTKKTLSMYAWGQDLSQNWVWRN
jgi:hypothetical protein